MSVIQTFPKGSGSGKGGHTILDTDGTSLAQEEKLQFKGLSVTDDPTNGITKVKGEGLNSDSIDDITSANTINPAVIIGDSNNYSTTEKIVGKWIDGKLIYQKTFTFSGIATKNWNHNIANIDKVIDWQAMINNGNGEVFDKVPENTGSAMIRPQVTLDKIYITSTFSDTDWQNGNGWITIQYTKTTD